MLQTPTQPIAPVDVPRGLARALADEAFRAVFDAAPVAILVVDDAGRIVAANGPSETMFGYGPGGLAGRPVEDLVPVGRRAAHTRERGAFLARPHARPMGHGLALEGLRRDGSHIPVEVGLSSVRVGGRTEVLVFVTDITPRQQAEAAVQAERSRLARELHDAVTQSLFSANVIADVLPALFERDPAAARDQLAELQGLTRGALAELRLLFLELRPGALAEAPLADLVRQLAAAAAPRQAVTCDVDTEGSTRLPPEVQHAVFRILQEALRNVERHAAARHVAIRLRQRPDDVGVEVEDDGVGFDPTAVAAGHFGLQFAQERAVGIGAALTIASRPGEGTRVSLRWPAPSVEPSVG